MRARIPLCHAAVVSPWASHFPLCLVVLLWRKRENIDPSLIGLVGGLSELFRTNRCLLSTQCARHRTVWSPNPLEMGSPKPPKGKKMDLIAPRAWTSTIPSARVLRSHPGTRSPSSPQRPGGACEHPRQVPPLLCPQPSRTPRSLVLPAPVKSRTTCPTRVRFRDKK